MIFLDKGALKIVGNVILEKLEQPTFYLENFSMHTSIKRVYRWKTLLTRLYSENFRILKFFIILVNLLVRCIM